MLSLRVAKPCTKSNSTLEVSLREQPFPERAMVSDSRGHGSQFFGGTWFVESRFSSTLFGSDG